MPLLVPLTAACVAYVAQLNHLPVQLLDGLRVTEGGTVGATTPNRDEHGKIVSWDLGPFQINDKAWVARFTQDWHLSSATETRELLISNGCANALAAATVFRIYLDEAGGNIGLAVGLYNSHKPILAERYRQHFIAAYTAFQRRIKDQP
jgi:hypothetical protein